MAYAHFPLLRKKLQSDLHMVSSFMKIFFLHDKVAK